MAKLAADTRLGIAANAIAKMILPNPQTNQEKLEEMKLIADINRDINAIVNKENCILSDEFEALFKRYEAKKKITFNKEKVQEISKALLENAGVIQEQKAHTPAAPEKNVDVNESQAPKTNSTAVAEPTKKESATTTDQETLKIIKALEKLQKANLDYIEKYDAKENPKKLKSGKFLVQFTANTTQKLENAKALRGTLEILLKKSYDPDFKKNAIGQIEGFQRKDKKALGVFSKKGAVSTMLEEAASAINPELQKKPKKH